jgi:hypothetical protein
MPLPTGRQEFEEWSDRIISGANLVADERSQKFMLANSLLQLGPVESHKEDAYFIHVLRVAAMRQVADARFREIREEQKAEWEAKEAERKRLEAESAHEYAHDQASEGPEIKVVKSAP